VAAGDPVTGAGSLAVNGSSGTSNITFGGTGALAANLGTSQLNLNTGNDGQGRSPGGVVTLVLPDTSASPTAGASTGGTLALTTLGLSGNNPGPFVVATAGANNLTGVFDNVTLNGVALVGSFTSGVGTDAGWTFTSGVDNVTFDDSTGVISATVPEPGTLGLLGVGALGLLARRRRIARRK